MKHQFWQWIILLSAQVAWGSPHPATSTSVLTNPEAGHYFQNQGFRLKSLGTDWLPTPQDEASASESVRFTPKGQIDSTASLSVRSDTLTKQSSLEAYAKKWMRDYPSYGFEVLGAKSFAVGGSPGLVVDMIQRSKNKQLRQVILQKGAHIAILTCLDNQASFQKTLVSCNQLVKNFEWNNK